MVQLDLPGVAPGAITGLLLSSFLRLRMYENTVSVTV